MVGVRLMSEMLDHAPASWTPSERLVVVAIAEQANDNTRRGYPGIELIAHRAGVDVGTVSRTLNRLRKKGAELRVPMEGVGNKGQAIYAVRGHRTVYAIPRLCPLPIHSTKLCVVKADAGPSFEADDPRESSDHRPPFSEERADHRPTKDGERADGGPESPDGGPPHPLSTLKDPSPQESGSPKPVPPQRDWKKLDADARRLDRLPEPLRTIAASLAETDPGSTDDDARAVLQWIADQARAGGNPVRGTRYYQVIAAGDGFSVHLANVRAQRRDRDAKAQEAAQTAAKEELARLRETEPECVHGTAAGASAHPTTGVILCPQCRRGLAAPPVETPAPPDRTSRVVDAYRAGWEKAGHEPIEMTTLIAIGGETRQLIADNHDLDFLTEIAALAGAARNTLLNTARKLSEAPR